MNYKQIFMTWFDENFAHTGIAGMMELITEDSPYHREANVWVHTQMVVRQYIERSPENWSKTDFLGALMCAFHDTGKPRAQEIHTRSDGTLYRSYKRHETYSGAEFLDYILSQDKDHIIRSLLSYEDIYNIQVMIVHHLPYRYDKEKSSVLKNHMDHFGLVDVFVRGVNSDAFGRISDNQSRTRSTSLEWGEAFKALKPRSLSHENSDKTLILLCGASGSGKSTYYSNTDTDAAIHSMDSVRLSSYGTDNYREAFELAGTDKGFNNKVMADLKACLKSHDTIYVDNTNVSRKSRNRYVKAGKYRTEAVYFLNNLETLWQRCQGRLSEDPSKDIPYPVLYRQYGSIQPPLVGEVGSVKVVYNGV